MQSSKDHQNLRQNNRANGNDTNDIKDIRESIAQLHQSFHQDFKLGYSQFEGSPYDADLNQSQYRDSFRQKEDKNDKVKANKKT